MGQGLSLDKALAEAQLTRATYLSARAIDMGLKVSQVEIIYRAALQHEPMIGLARPLAGRRTADQS